MPNDNFVTVACKLPHGLQIKVGDKAVNLRGTNTPDAIGGYGFTLVDESFWKEWLALYQNFQPVKKGLIFAHPKGRPARDQAKEQAEIKNGLEPLDASQPIRGVGPADKAGLPETDAVADMEEAA